MRAEAGAKPCIGQSKDSDPMRRVKGGEVEEEVVVLSRTDRKGMARPLPEGTHPKQTFSGKRRKKEKVNLTLSLFLAAVRMYLFKGLSAFFVK